MEASSLKSSELCERVIQVACFLFPVDDETDFRGAVYLSHLLGLSIGGDLSPVLLKSVSSVLSPYLLWILREYTGG